MNGNCMKKFKKILLNHIQTEVYCRLGVSPVHGIGVFAIREIPSGVNPLSSLVSNEEVEFSKSDLKKLPKSVLKVISIFCYFEKNKVLVPAIGLNAMNMAVYLNHSKKPNVKFNKKGELETLKPINAGDELMIDYDLSFGEKHTFK